MTFVRDCFDTDEINISRLVTSSKENSAYMCIDTQIEVQSDLKLSIEGIEHAGQWALKISEALRHLNTLIHLVDLKYLGLMSLLSRY